MSYLGCCQNRLGDDETPAPANSGNIFTKLLSPLMPSLNQAITDPLVAKMQPVIKQTLLEIAPTWGLWIGIGMGSLFLIGVTSGLLTTKERQKARR